MTAAQGFTMADVLHLLSTDEDGDLVGYRQKALLHALLSEHLTPRDALGLLFAGDVAGLDRLIFEQEHSEKVPE